MKAEELIAKAKNIVAPPPSVAKLLTLLANEDAGNEDIIEVISTDGVMSAKLLSLCNAAVYGLATPVSSIEQAVLYLGHSEIHRLAMSAGFGAALNPALKGYAIGESELWQHSLLTAHVAVIVDEKMTEPLVDTAIAYTAGLIHDIGKIVVNRAVTPEMQALLMSLMEKKQHTLITAERSVLGTDHAEVGALLLKKWRLPEILVEAVAHHHEPVTTPKIKLSTIIHVADLIAHEAGGSPGIGSYAVNADEKAITALDLKPEDLEKFVIAAYDSQADVASMQTVA